LDRPVRRIHNGARARANAVTDVEICVNPASLTPYSGPDFTIRIYQVAAEAIGSIRTLDAGRGIIEIWIAPGAESVVDRLLAAVETPVQRLDEGFD
jgi:hypothetical protein